MLFSFNWLKELSGYNETPQKLAELLTLRVFEVEGMEKVGSDWTLDIKISTNRMMDAASHEGMAREIAAISRISNFPASAKASAGKQASISKQKETQKKAEKFPIKITIAGKNLCPRYTAQLIRISNNPVSPAGMQERLIACGFRPINAVVDVTNYVMLETGMPLHAFDADEIRGGHMTIQESREGDRMTTLDGVERVLSAGTIIIEDGGRLIDVAGIMGGANSAISGKTQTIFLQAAVFDPGRIYRATRLLKHNTDASKRYASGVDPAKTVRALAHAAELLEQIAGARQSSGVFDWYPEKKDSLKILFDTSRADGLIGITLGSEFYKQTFVRLGFGVRPMRGGLMVEVPSDRGDIARQEDLAEEVVRMYGYDRIPSTFPTAAIVPAPLNDELYWQERIQDIAVGAGFTEHEPYAFTSGRALDDFAIGREGLISVENPMNPDTTHLTPRPLTAFVEAAARQAREFESVRLFGIAKGFRFWGENRNKGTRWPVNETKYLVFALSRKGGEGEDEFFELKGVLDEVFTSLGIADYWYDDAIEPAARSGEYAMYHPYRTAQIRAGNELLGVLGEIHPATGERIKQKSRITAAEISFDWLWRLARREQEFRPVGKYPAVMRDIAVIVPFFTKTEEVTNVIETAGGALLADSDLFDYFQDERMKENDEKSLTFRLIFQSPDRTLTDEEVHERIDTITRALEKKGWNVRK